MVMGHWLEWLNPIAEPLWIPTENKSICLVKVRDSSHMFMKFHFHLK